MSDIDWRAALGAELAPVLAALARGEGAAPAMRYRVEGFARGICALGIAPAEEVVSFIREAYHAALGPAAADHSAGDFSDEGLPSIPVRLPRAPVYPGSSS